MNEEFEKSFGLKVPDDAHGCLQDIHWSAGLIGYFPTYSLGNLNGAQLYATALREKPEIEGELKSGVYGTLLGLDAQQGASPGQCPAAAGIDEGDHRPVDGHRRSPRDADEKIPLTLSVLRTGAAATIRLARGQRMTS